MSDTHVNAYALELQDKKNQLVSLKGEVEKLEAIVKSMTPDEEPEAKPKKEAKPAKEAKPVADEEVTQEATQSDVAEENAKELKPVDTPVQSSSLSLGKSKK